MFLGVLEPLANFDVYNRPIYPKNKKCNAE